MMLYELALELDLRSMVLLDRAHAMGMNVDTMTKLTPEQVEELRTAYGKGRGMAAHGPVSGMPGQPGSGLPGDDKPVGAPAIAAMAIAGLVVVLLAAYMITNSGGPDTPGPDQAVAAGASEDDEPTATTAPCDPGGSGIGIGAIGQGVAGTTVPPAGGATTAPPAGGASTTVVPDAEPSLPPCDVVGGLSGEDIGPSTTFVGDPIDRPRDEREFCKAALSAMEFEQQMMDAANAADLGALRNVMIGGRDRWKSDVVIMTAGAPPRIDVAVERYRLVYTGLLDSVTPEGDDYQLANAFWKASRTDLQYYITQIFDVVNTNCSKR